jgi:hypothetical protein
MHVWKIPVKLVNGVNSVNEIVATTQMYYENYYIISAH